MSKKDNSAELPPRRPGRRSARYAMLSQWYGPERAAVEISAHTCQPRKIDSLLEDVLFRIRRPENGVLLTLRSKWSEIVGSMFAKFTEAEALQDGVLTLKVRHSALLAELRPSCDLIVKRVNEAAGGNVCTSVLLRV